MKILAAAFAASILCVIINMPAIAQEADVESGGGDQYTHVPFSLSFVPGISTSGFMGGDIVTNCSINIIAGRYAKLRGVEFGSVLNWETEEVYGAQFSGVVNIVEGHVLGLQQAGTANIVLGDLEGLQMSGAVNYVGGNVRVGQLGGAVNVALGDMEGIQMAGAINYVGGDLEGLQMAGSLNLTPGHVQGAQIGVVNIGGDVRGAQVGVVNIAHRVEGAQVGVVNYADELEGAPVGLFSFVRKGRMNVAVWGSETSAANIALKTGSKHFYSILALGYQPSFGDDPYRWSPGVGMGVHIPIESRYVNIEAIHSHINEDEAWTEDLHQINSLRLIAGWHIDPRISVFAGVTMNVFVSQFNDGSHIAYGSLYEETGGDTWVRMWPGFVAGVQF
jgi:hypothetical protein